MKAQLIAKAHFFIPIIVFVPTVEALAAQASGAIKLSCPFGAELVETKFRSELELACTKPDGIRSGPFQSKYSNGKVAIVGDYKNGDLDGLFSEFDLQGNKTQSGFHRQGKMHGVWTRWYKNGLKRDEGQWDHNVPVGQWQFWHENGKKKAIRSFSKGSALPEGEWKSWNQNEQLLESGFYRRGEKVCTWSQWTYPESYKGTYMGKSSEMHSENRAENHSVAILKTEVYKPDFYCQRFILKLFEFQISPFVANQTLGGKTYSILYGWSPHFQVSTLLGLRVEAQASVLSGKNATKFLFSEGAVLGTLRPTLGFPLSFEAGPGGQIWIGNGGFVSVFTGKVNWNFKQNILNIINRLTLAVTTSLRPSRENNTQLYKAGIGISL